MSRHFHLWTRPIPTNVTGWAGTWMHNAKLKRWPEQIENGPSATRNRTNAAVGPRPARDDGSYRLTPLGLGSGLLHLGVQKVDHLPMGPEGTMGAPGFDVG